MRLDVFAVGSPVPYGPRSVEAIVAVFRQFVRGTVGDAIGYDTGLRLLQRPVVYGLCGTERQAGEQFGLLLQQVGSTLFFRNFVLL